jgi:uncharacterized membrane protein
VKVFYGRVFTVIALGAYIAAALWFSSHTIIYSLFRSSGGAHVEYEKARVLEIKGETLNPDTGKGMITGRQDLYIQILTGEKSGTELEMKNFLNYSSNFRLKAGDEIIVRVDFDGIKDYNVTLFSIDRGPALYGLALLFFTLLCIIGGMRGLRSISGIICTFTGIVFIFIPMLYRGYSPVFAAVLVTSATSAVSLILLDGFKAKTIAAILGSIAGLAVSAFIVLIFKQLAMVSGFTTGDSDYMLQISDQTGMKMGELLFAAVLIASLGAVMDIAISVASSVSEVAAADPGLSRAELFASGINIGKDITGMMTNTLILAFTGTSLNALILLYALGNSWLRILNSDTIAVDIIETLTGCIAVILTVPAVAYISALFARPAVKNPI